MEDLVGDRRESWALNWQIKNPNQGLTLVLRTKPTEGIVETAPSNGFAENKFLYLSPRNGAFQEALAYWYPDELSFSQSELKTAFTDTGWTIYRLTLKGDAFRLYINEDPVPVISGSSPKTSTANTLLLGDNTPEPYGSYFDWIIWDLGGAYPPGEGRMIPDSLYTGLGGSTTRISSYPEAGSKTNFYPNPAISEITIKAKSGDKVSIFNQTGSLVSEFIMNADVIHLNICDFSPGIYILTFEGEEGIVHGKLIKR